MSEKKEWSVMDYDYTKTYPNIDYSEVITEPGLVLSMREIYNRYAAAGVDLLNGQLVEDPDDDSVMHDFDPDDNVDVLAQARDMQRIGSERQRTSKRSASKTEKAPEKEPDQSKEPDKSEQSGDAEGE